MVMITLIALIFYRWSFLITLIALILYCWLDTTGLPSLI